MLLCHKIHLFQKLLTRKRVRYVVFSYFCKIKKTTDEYSYRKI